VTNDDINKLYQGNIDISHLAALRAIYNAGYFAGAVITPNSMTADQSKVAPVPTTKLKITKPD
jgi:hypothetical protein